MDGQEAANVAVVKRFYALLGKGDRDGAYAACMAEDCVLHEAASLPYGGIYAGRNLMKTTLSGVTGSFDEFRYEIRNYLAGGDEVVVASSAATARPSRCRPTTSPRTSQKCSASRRPEVASRPTDASTEASISAGRSETTRTKPTSSFLCR